MAVSTQYGVFETVCLFHTQNIAVTTARCPTDDSADGHPNPCSMCTRHALRSPDPDTMHGVCVLAQRERSAVSSGVRCSPPHTALLDGTSASLARTRYASPQRARGAERKRSRGPCARGLATCVATRHQYRRVPIARRPQLLPSSPPPPTHEAADVSRVETRRLSDSRYDSTEPPAT